MKNTTDTLQQGIGYTIGGGMMLGIGAGFLTDNLIACALLGLGGGLVAAALITFLRKK